MTARTSEQLFLAGETAATIRAALAAHDAERRAYAASEAGAQQFFDRRDDMLAELAIIEGRIPAK